MSKINILVKEPGEDWHKETIEDELSEYQRIVEGYIEIYYLGDHTLILCNEEGWLNGLEYNCTIDGNDFAGTIIMLKENGEEFASIW